MTVSGRVGHRRRLVGGWPQLVWLLLAAPPRAELAIEISIAPEAAEHCPNGAGMTERLGARLGYLPEEGPNAARARIAIERAGQTLIGSLHLERAGAEPKSARLESVVEECSALFDSLALSLALAIDPLGSGRAREPPAQTHTASAATPPPPPPAPRTEPVAPVAIDRPPVEPDPPVERASVRVSLGAVVPFLALPGSSAPAFGPVAGVGWFRGALALSAEATFLVPQSRELAAGAVTVSSFTARGAVCWRSDPLSLCGVIGAGALFAGGEGVGSQDRSGSAATVGLGPRVALDLPLGERAGIQLAGTLELLPARAELRLGREALWTMPVARAELMVSPWMVVW